MTPIHPELRPIHQVGGRTLERLVPAAICPALATGGVRLCGTSDARPGFQFMRPQPDMCQILACRAGEGAVLVDGLWRRLGPGQAYLTDAAHPHAYRADRPGAWRLAWAIHDPGTWYGPPRLIACDAEGLGLAVEGLQRELARSGQGAVAAAWAATLLTSLAAARDAGAGDPVLGSLWALVDAEPAAPWTLERLAARSGLHAEALRRRCRKSLGRAPMHQVAELRLRQAAALLAGRRLPVQAVAERVGYACPFAFSAAFRRRFGRPPSRFP